MDNENNSLYEEENQNNNNRKDLIKFIFSAIINILIIVSIFLYLMKYNLSTNDSSYNIYKKQKKSVITDLRILDDDDFFNRVERKIIFNIKNAFIEDEMKKYLNLLLENLGSGFDSFHNKIISKEAYYLEKEKQIFFSRLIKNIYSGTWEYFPYIPDEDEKANNISKIVKFYYTNSSQKQFKIGSYKNGSVKFNFKKALEMTTKQEALALTMHNLEGNYNDNWIEHISYAKFNELSRIIDENNKLYSLKGEFVTTMAKGKIFKSKKKNNKKMECTTLVEIEFPLTYIILQTTLNNKSIPIKNISTINPSNFTMILSSTCGFRIKVKAEIYNDTKEYYETKEKVNYFSYFSIFGSILYLIGASCLIYSLNNNENAISGISLECFCQNVAWHSYCGMTNINLGLSYPEYFIKFCLLALFPLLNFVIFDLCFLYFFWKIKKRVLNDRQFIKLRLKFFLIFYGLLLFSVFSISSFFTNKIYITVLFLFLWTPQIIHNIMSNNKYIYPTFYIFATTIDRLIYPLYFRGYKDNFTHLKSDKTLIIVLLIFILITIVILYLQAFLGARFMLTTKYQKKNIDFHKSKEELLQERPDCIKEECVICLSPLIGEETKNKNNDNKNTINNDDNKHIDDIIIQNEQGSEHGTDTSSDNPTELKIEQTNRSYNSRIDLIQQQNINIKNNNDNKKILKNELHLCNNNNGSLSINVKNTEKNKHNNNNNFSFKNIFIILKIIFIKSMFKFYKLKNNLEDKPYMLIACGHIFHTNCVEKWFDRKKECPNCRASMEEYL